MTIEQYWQQDVYGNPVNNPKYPTSSSDVSSPQTIVTHTTTIHSALPVQHLNILEYLLGGTSPLEWLLNGLIYFLIIRFILWPVIITPILDLLDYHRQRSVKTSTLELIPPAVTTKSAEATTELFKSLHSLYSLRSYKDQLLRRKQIFTLELTSTREEGIRFIARVPSSHVASFKRKIIAYLPEVQINKINDYLTIPTRTISFNKFLEFKQLGNYELPLAAHKSLASHDPLNQLREAIAKPSPSELFVWQYVISPQSSKLSRRIRSKLKQGKNPMLLSYRYNFPRNLRFIGMNVLNYALRFLRNLTYSIIGVFSATHILPKYYKRSSGHQLMSTLAEDERQKVISKLSEPLFSVDIRAYIGVNSQHEAYSRRGSIISSLSAFNDSEDQRLVPSEYLYPPLLRQLLKMSAPKKLRQKYMHYQETKFVNRLPSALSTNSSKLSASEMAGLYHFPYGSGLQTENIAKSPAKTLPAPAVIKKHSDNADFDVVLGRNYHHGNEVDIGLTRADRESHAYIVGGTGNGKSTIMEYAILQDIRRGKGVAFIDPHGDSAKRLLHYIPEDRIQDVIYFNPRDIDYPVGLNLLQLPKGLSGGELEYQQDLLTEAIISVLNKVFEDNRGTSAHRIDRILRNTIQTAFTVEDATIFTVLRLLTDSVYRKKITKKLPVGRLKQFWKEELGESGEMQRVKISIGPITRVERYDDSVSAKRVLGQSHSTINFDNIMNSRKILICNFSKGALGEDTSNLFCVTTLAMIQLATYRRENVEEQKRVPFYLYVDEFQNFATKSFMGLFSEARKFKLFLTMAQQSMSQLKEQSMLNTVLDNIGTVIVFRSKSPATEKTLLHQFGPYVEPGEISNLPRYDFYIKIAAESSLEPMSGRTLLLGHKGSKETMDKVIAESRKRYTNKFQEENPTITNKQKVQKLVDVNVQSEEDNNKAGELISIDSIDIF